VIYVLAPMAVQALRRRCCSTSSQAQNEAFWTLNDWRQGGSADGLHCQLLSSPEGLFLRQIIRRLVHGHRAPTIMGWFGQKRLVRGLTFGAVK
jgi:sorbitol/mannitol transport system permease protein